MSKNSKIRRAAQHACFDENCNVVFSTMLLRRMLLVGLQGHCGQICPNICSILVMYNIKVKLTSGFSLLTGQGNTSYCNTRVQNTYTSSRMSNIK